MAPLRRGQEGDLKRDALIWGRDGAAPMMLEGKQEARTGSVPAPGVMAWGKVLGSDPLCWLWQAMRGPGSERLLTS